MRLRWSSVIEYLPRMFQVLDLIPNATLKRKGRREEERRKDQESKKD
jgi:hypothetical protein